jgi:hypothetical protein
MQIKHQDGDDDRENRVRKRDHALRGRRAPGSCALQRTAAGQVRA